MTIVRWEPLRELNSLQSEMNRLFNTVFDQPSGTSGTVMRRWMPAMDLAVGEPQRAGAGTRRGVAVMDVEAGHAYSGRARSSARSCIS